MTSEKEIKKTKANCYKPNITLNKIIMEILKEWLEDEK